MEDREEIYLLIDQYLNGQLGKKEIKALEQRIEEDEDFKALFLSFTSSEAVVRKYFRSQRAEELKALYQPVQKNRGLSYAIPYWGYAAAATALLLIVYVLYPFKGSQPNTPEALFDTYMKAPSFSASRSVAHDKWEAARTAYDGKEYATTINYLREIPVDSISGKRVEKASYFMGISHLMQDNADSAIYYLSFVSDTSIYGEAKMWYLALASLRNAETGKAIKYLQDIIDYPNHYKQTEAKALLQSLEGK